MTLVDIVRNLRSYSEEPVGGQEPTIYAAEPWTAYSQAIVSWSMPKGGLPDDVAAFRLVRFVEVQSAIRLLAGEYDQLMASDCLDELCVLLIAQVNKLVTSQASSRR